MPENLAVAADEPISMLSADESMPVFDPRETRAADWFGEGSLPTFKVTIGNSSVKIQTNIPGLPDWLIGVVSDLNRLARLPADWDSYGAFPIDQRTLEHALQVIIQIMDIDVPPPQVGATVRGGIEFEWHCDGNDLEIQVEGPFRVHAYFCDETADEEWEENVGISVDRLKPYLNRLTG